MAEMDHEFPIREEFPVVKEEFPLPEPEAEYRPPDPSSELSPPPGSDYDNPAEALEFTPPGTNAAQAVLPSGKRARRIRRLLYAAAALVLTGLLFHPGVSSTSLEAPSVLLTPAPSAALPQPTAEPGAEPTAEPTPKPTPVSKIPVITTDFFCFSHEHHGRVYMDNIGALHSVQVTVREKVLDKQVYDRYLSEEEIASGAFELPMLSTGDVFMENMEAYNALNGWPELEMTVKAWYENEAGDGEDMLTLTVEPEFEMGIGLSYIPSSWSWYEDSPVDSFVISPWEETEDIRYVIDDPDAVKNPLTFSVDLSYNGRHAAPEEYEEIVRKEEYTLITSSGEEIPTVAYTKTLVLRRPDWMPEEGTIHVTIRQYLASTGEVWVRDFDFDYSAN